jgi:hypothetical protein
MHGYRRRCFPELRLYSRGAVIFQRCDHRHGHHTPSTGCPGRSRSSILVYMENDFLDLFDFPVNRRSETDYRRQARSRGRSKPCSKVFPKMAFGTYPIGASTLRKRPGDLGRPASSARPGGKERAGLEAVVRRRGEAGHRDERRAGRRWGGCRRKKPGSRSESGTWRGKPGTCSRRPAIRPPAPVSHPGHVSFSKGGYPLNSTSVGPAQANLHQVLADDQLSGEVALRLQQMLARRIAGHDMIEDQRIDPAGRCDRTDRVDRRV